MHHGRREVFVIACAAAFAAMAPRSLVAQGADVAKILFASGAGGLTPAQQNEIATKADFLRVAPDGKSLVETICEQPAQTEVNVTDLNGDQVPEVFLLVHSGCLGGATGSTVTLFIRDAGGQYQANLGFPGTMPEMLEQKNQGYPDLAIGGPGFCFPVWSWTGKEYAHSRNAPQEPGGCDQQ